MLDTTQELAEASGSYRRHLRAENKSSATVSIYVMAVDRFRRFVEAHGMPVTVGGIRREHIEAFLVHL